jgi:hypothetical protein
VHTRLIEHVSTIRTILVKLEWDYGDFAGYPSRMTTRTSEEDMLALDTALMAIGDEELSTLVRRYAGGMSWWARHQTLPPDRQARPEAMEKARDEAANALAQAKRILIDIEYFGRRPARLRHWLRQQIRGGTVVGGLLKSWAQRNP